MTDLDSAGARSATAGAGIVDTARATAASIQDGDWGEFATNTGILALDGLATAVDPVGAALAAGVGWLMEHFGPLTELLDTVAGDPNAIQAGADVWSQVQAELEQLASEVPGMAERDLATWTGEARCAYDDRTQDLAAGVQALSISAGSAAAVIAIAGTMVATCRAIIRDIIAAVVAELIKGALIALATSVISFGATVAGYIGYAVGRIGMKVAEIGAKISKLLAKLGQAGAKLAKILDDIAQVGAKIGKTIGSSGRASAGLGDVAGALGRGSTRVSGFADELGEAAGRLGTRGADAASVGRFRIDNADAIGRAGAERILNPSLIRGEAGQDIARTLGNVANDKIPNPIGIAARAPLYEQQGHEQNDAEDIAEGNATPQHDQYDGYNYRGDHTGDTGEDGWYDRNRPASEPR